MMTQSDLKIQEIWTIRATAQDEDDARLKNKNNHNPERAKMTKAEYTSANATLQVTHGLFRERGKGVWRIQGQKHQTSVGKVES